MRKLIFLLAIIAVLALALTACGGSDSAEPDVQESTGDTAAGEELFVTCSACHGPDGKGLPNLGKDLTTSEFIKERSDSELVDFLKVGRPAGDPLNTTGVDMPPKGGNPALTDQQLLDIVAYVRTLK